MRGGGGEEPLVSVMLGRDNRQASLLLETFPGVSGIPILASKQGV